MKLKTILFASFLCSATILAQQNPPVRIQVPLKAQPFELRDVRLLNGPVHDLLERNHQYLLSLNVDRLVRNFRVNAGIPTKAVPLGGWEAPDCELRGHFTGHFMTACALMYAATGDEKMKAKGNAVVAALAECQHALGSSGYLSAFPEEFIDRVETGRWVWAPYYTLHKILAGLLDMATLCQNAQALTVAEQMAGWVKMRTDKLDDKQMQDMLKVEFGGMAEALEDLSAMTGKKVYLDLARRFEKRSFLDPLMEQRDQLKGLHANTHIPQAIGAARAYELTGDESYYTAASYFWNEVVDARSYATGGTSNYEYWRDEPNRLADQLSQETHENCCTYNMLRLTKHLYSWTADARYIDYYERALFNGILPTYHPEVGGAIMYFVPLKSGLFKMFGVPDSSYFCCNGSGIESFSKLANTIYYHNEDNLFVNLFIASEVGWRSKEARLSQQTNFPEQDGTTLRVQVRRPIDFTLQLRIPAWTADNYSIRLNGKKIETRRTPEGYVAMRRIWKSGDRIDVHLPMTFRLEPCPDDRTVAAILYGPIVLAGELGTKGMTRQMQNGLGWADVERMVSQGAAAETPVLVPPVNDPNAWIKPVAGKALTFRTHGVGIPNDVTLIPFYRMFGQRYAVYFQIDSPAEWQAMRQAAHPLPSGTVDRVIVGDPASDREHNFQAWRFQSGERDGKKWVNTPLWLRYDLMVIPAGVNMLQCVVWGNGKGDSVDVLVDGLPLKDRSVAAVPDQGFIKMTYNIPSGFVKGKKRVAVTFKAVGKIPTPELYDCAIVSGEQK